MAVRSTLRDKGQLTLPAEVRKALHIEAGDDVEFVVLEGGQVLLRGLRLVAADQAWFWTEQWQEGERRASEDIAAGRIETLEDEEALLDLVGGSDDTD